MKKAAIWLITAAFLVIVGLALFSVTMWQNDWDFSALSTVEYVTNTYEIEEDFSEISILADTVDVTLSRSDDGSCRIVCREAQREVHTVSVIGDTLTIQVQNKKTWHDYIGIATKSPRITLYLPQAGYNSLTSKTSTGDVAIHGLAFGTVDISVSTGDIRLCDVSCKSLTTTGNTGDVSLENVLAEGRISIERSTGDVIFSSCDAAEIFVKTSTGDVFGSLRSEKVFVTTTSTGDVWCPSSASGGRCEIVTSTGDIKISLE